MFLFVYFPLTHERSDGSAHRAHEEEERREEEHAQVHGGRGCHVVHAVNLAHGDEDAAADTAPFNAVNLNTQTLVVATKGFLFISYSFNGRRCRVGQVLRHHRGGFQFHFSGHDSDSINGSRF